jgi:predicted nuclease of restriction endonuclease-like (RecB) superfamily
LEKRQHHIEDEKNYLYKKRFLMSEFQQYNQPDFYNKVANLLKDARRSVVQTVNKAMVYTYFEIGRMIVEEEQNGKERAEYGKQILKELSKRLNAEFGKGFSQRNLEQMRQFYLIYSKTQTLSAEFNLSWSHYLKLMRIDNEEERSYYQIEAYENSWSLRELQRQFDSGLYERLVLSRDKKAVKELSKKGQVIEKPKDTIKDPYILEFIGLPENSQYSETELEQKIIDKLEHFLLELGKGYAFIGRQVRFTFDERHFRVDLVFYNRLLQCFVLIDLKIGEINHQDLGQMQMYVNYYDRFVKLDTENKTIGIVLCKDKNDTVVEITLPENNEQIFASKYQTVLPSKKELKQLIENKEDE